MDVIGDPTFDMFELSPLWLRAYSVDIEFVLCSLLADFGSASSEWSPGLRYMNNICPIF